MELQRLSLCVAFLVLAVISQCSEGRHAIRRRESDYTSDEMLKDESNDYGAQNDADGGNDADEDDAVEDGVILTKGDHYRLLIGRSVRLECRTSPAEGTVVSWSKNEEKIFFGKNKVIQSDRFSLVPNSSDLLIRDLELSDTGRYTCEIMQMSPASITHVVIVEEPPRVNNPETSTMENIDYEDNKPRIVRFSASDNGQLREGSDLLLTCEVSGTPRPSILWSRQKQFGLGTESLTEANGEFSNNTFFMKNISREDSGAYYCYAVSDAGNATAVLTVNIVGKPRVHVHRPVVNTDIGVEAQLQCSVHEEPTPFIRWYKDENLIEDSSVEFTVSNNGSLSTLTVTPRKDEDFGMFTCEAQNAHDVHSKSIELVQRPVVENLDVQGPKLSWTVHSHQPLEDIEVHLKQLDGEGELRTFKVPLPESKAHEYELIYVLDNDIVQDGTYEATVKVRNNKSWSRHSDPARVKLERQAEPIQTASVFRGNNSAHSVRPTTFALTTILMYLLVRML